MVLNENDIRKSAPSYRKKNILNSDSVLLFICLFVRSLDSVSACVYVMPFQHPFSYITTHVQR